MTYLEKEKKKWAIKIDELIEEEQSMIDLKVDSLKSALKEGGKRVYAIALCDSISVHYSIQKGLEISKSKL